MTSVDSLYWLILGVGLTSVDSLYWLILVVSLTSVDSLYWEWVRCKSFKNKNIDILRHWGSDPQSLHRMDATKVSSGPPKMNLLGLLIQMLRPLVIAQPTMDAVLKW